MVTAVVGSLLLNYFFPPPLHTLTIRDTNNTLALLVFIGARRFADEHQPRFRVANAKHHLTAAKRMQFAACAGGANVILDGGQHFRGTAHEHDRCACPFAGDSLCRR